VKEISIFYFLTFLFAISKSLKTLEIRLKLGYNYSCASNWTHITMGGNISSITDKKCMLFFIPDKRNLFNHETKKCLSSLQLYCFIEHGCFKSELGVIMRLI